MFSVRKRPFSGDDSSKFSEFGAVAIQHDSNDTPPLAISFCKVGFFYPCPHGHLMRFFRVQMIESYKYEIWYFSYNFCQHTMRLWGLRNLNIHGQVKCFC